MLAEEPREFLNGVLRKPLLSAAGERRLARRARAGCRRSRDELIGRNMRLVASVAGRYRGLGLPYEDLIQEGNCGLIRAADRFKPEMGYRFSTYATYWIRQALGNAIVGQVAAIHLPKALHEQLRTIERAGANFEASHGREPGVEELASVSGMDAERLRSVLDVPRVVMSLDAGVQGDDGEEGLPLAGAVAAPLRSAARPPLLGEGEALDASQAALAAVCVEVALPVLDERKRYVLTRRYGLDGGPQATLQEIGGELGVVKERVRVLECEALAALALDMGAVNGSGDY